MYTALISFVPVTRKRLVVANTVYFCERLGMWCCQVLKENLPEIWCSEIIQVLNKEIVLIVLSPIVRFRLM